LGIGDWAQSPIPNPQSPIPNPHLMIQRKYKKIILNLKLLKNYLFYELIKLKIN